MCGRDASQEGSQTFVLTEDEKAKVVDARDEYVYCKPCWSILSDPVSGPALMSGIAQHHLRNLGVSNVEELTARYRAALTAKAKRRS